MQHDLLTVTDPAAVRTLQNIGFLGRFYDPASPSDVARSLKMPANLAHHYARQALALGLLFEARREGRRVYLQLAAKTFRHDMRLLPLGDQDERMTGTLRALQERFLHEYDRSQRLASGQDPEWTLYSFRGSNPMPESDAERPLPESRLAHYSSRTLRLSPHAYAQLVRALALAMREAQSEDLAGADVCTVALFAFDGPLLPGLTDSASVSSWISEQ